MVYITRKTPTNYRNRHSDWYNGVFREVVHQIGLVGEALFWLDCEGKCNFIDTLIPDWFPLNYIQDGLINIFKAHYNAKYTHVYDDWCLQACKSFEVLEGQVNNVLGQIKGKVDEARAWIEQNLTNPLKDKINKEIIPQVNNVVNKIRDAESQVRSIQSKVSDELEPLISQVQTRLRYTEEAVKQAQNKVNEAVSKVNDLDAQVRDAVNDLNAQVRDATSSLENFRSKLNESIETLNSHTGDISKLFDRVRNLEAGTPTSESSFDELVRRVKEALG